MTGRLTRVGTRLHRSSPYLVAIHCVAHLLALVCHMCRSSREHWLLFTRPVQYEQQAWKPFKSCLTLPPSKWRRPKTWDGCLMIRLFRPLILQNSAYSSYCTGMRGNWEWGTRSHRISQSNEVLRVCCLSLPHMRCFASPVPPVLPFSGWVYTCFHH